jgi:hypothetical protein
MSFRGVDATMMAPSDPSDAIDLVEMIKDLTDSDPEKAAEYARTLENLMGSTARKLSAELRVVVTRAVQAGLTQDEVDDHGPAGALDEGGSVFEGLDLDLDREMQMILEESGLELGDGLAQPNTTEGELGLRSAIGLAGEYSPAGRTEMQLSSLDDTPQAGGLDIPSSAEGSVHGAQPEPEPEPETEPGEPSPSVTELITATSRVAADIRTTSRSIADAANAAAEAEIEPGATVKYYAPASAEAANARSRQQARQASLLAKDAAVVADDMETAVRDIGEGSARLISAEHAYLAMRQAQASTPGSNHPGMLTDGDPTEINSITKCLTDRVLKELSETVETVVRLHLSLLEPAVNKKVDERIANQSDSITVDQGKVRRKAQAIFDVNYTEVCNIVEQRSTTRDRLMTQSSDHVAKDTAFHKSNDEGAKMRDNITRYEDKITEISMSRPTNESANGKAKRAALDAQIRKIRKVVEVLTERFSEHSKKTERLLLDRKRLETDKESSGQIYWPHTTNESI